MTDRTRTRATLVGFVVIILVLAGGVASATVGAAGTQEESLNEPNAVGQATPQTDCEFDRVFDDAIPSVATVRVFSERGDVGQGSAWVYELDGDEALLVTNQHVIRRSIGADVRFANGEWRSVRQAVGIDPYADLAVLRVSNVPDYVEPLEIAQERPEEGDQVAALGSPFGLEGTISTGIVSAVDRSVTVGIDPDRELYTVTDAIQTDAAVNPGNSGGPLVNCAGHVVGVNFAGISPIAGQNINYAISAAMVQRIVPSLIENGTYEHSYMGIRGISLSPTLARINGIDGTTQGVLVENIIAGGPAAGVLQGSPATERVTTLPVGGDVLTAVDGEPIGDVEDLRDYLFDNTRPGDEITVTVLRDGERQDVTLTLVAQPPARERIGFEEPSI